MDSGASSKRSRWGGGRISWLAAFLGWAAFSVASVAEEPIYRNFTNKEGKQIEARIMSVSTDRKTVKIAQRDGREFDLEIVLLSLDDQQVLREWLLTRPAAADVRLEVAIDKISERSSKRERDRQGYYRFTTEYPQYRVTMTNLDRATVIKPVLEYCVLHRERLSILYSEDLRDWVYSTIGGDDGRVMKTQGKIELEDLVFNREQIASTPMMVIERALGDGNYVYGEDELIGLLVRVTDSQGNPLGTWTSADTEIAKYPWDRAVTFDDAPEPAAAAQDR